MCVCCRYRCGVFLVRHSVRFFSVLCHQRARREQVQLWKGGHASDVQRRQPCYACLGRACVHLVRLHACRIAVAMRVVHYSLHMRLSLQRLFENVQRKYAVVGVNESHDEDVHRARRRVDRFIIVSCTVRSTTPQIGQFR